MTLHEIYETLLRRGMPEHPTLRHGSVPLYPAGVITSADMGNLWTLNGVRVAESDARDLLTMHALRWWVRVKTDVQTRVTVAYPMSSLEQVLASAAVCLFDANTGILEVVETATRHLEPK